MRSHDRFESLAGAIALGEASPDERALFAAHADACALCRDDARSPETSPLASIAAARDEEVWRPTLDRAILTRIRDRDSERSRFTVGALGWAAGLSIAANFVFATGFAAQVAHALTPAPAPAPIATLGIRLPAQTFARTPAIPELRAIAFAPRRSTRARAPLSARRSFAHLHAPAATHVAPEIPATSSEPDVFADLLDTNTSPRGRSVAIETSFVHSESLQP